MNTLHKCRTDCLSFDDGQCPFRFALNVQQVDQVYCDSPVECEQRGWLPYPENVPERNDRYGVMVFVKSQNIALRMEATWHNGKFRDDKLSPFVTNPVVAFRELPAPWDGVKRGER